jgi:hypothetical protein
MRRLALLAACLMSPAAANAQAPQFLPVNDTLEIEVHGLRTWTAQGLNDTLARISPGLSLASHACAGVMRRFLGFADAGVMYEPRSADGIVRVVITAIEPGDSALVRRVPSPPGARPPIESWQPTLSILRNEFPALFPLQLPRFLRGETDSIGPPGRAATPTELKLRGEIRAHASARDLEDALTVLRDDSTSWHRIAAIWMLTNFPNDARAWGALLGAARSERPMGYETWALATMVPPWGDGSVSLAPHEETLAALVSGTGAMQIMFTLRLLNTVTLEPTLARSLAVAGRDLLLSNLQSRVPNRRDAARTFLERASGESHGDDVEAWRRWLDR